MLENILNAHSLWFETLAETGIVGWLLLAGFFALTIIRGAVRALHSAAPQRTVVAAAVAGLLAFCAAASFDWSWQIGVMPMVTMLLAASTFKAELVPVRQDRGTAGLPARRWLSLRLLLAPVALLAMILIAIPFGSSVELTASQAAFRKGNLDLALADAKTAHAIEPGAASPYLQEAFVFQQANDIQAAVRAIHRAIRAEPDNYNLWLTAELMETEADHPRRALADYKRALLLFPSIPTQIG